MEHDELVRSLAVAMVDIEHGFTMEHAPSPEAHRHEYDEIERRLLVATKVNRVRLVDAR